MDETTYRILDMLARNIGRFLSINGLRAKIEEAYHTGFYKNIHDRVQGLAKQGILKTEFIGKSLIVNLNLGSYQTLSMLSEMELKKKRELTEANHELGMLLLEMETYFSQDLRLISHISAINPEGNIKLRRAEFLFILKGPQSEDRAEIKAIRKLMEELQKGHNLRLDYLILSQAEFFRILSSNEYNPIKPMIASKLTLLYPQNYWLSIREFLAMGLAIQPAEEINPAKTSESDLEYNLARFGYKELGGKLKKGKEICLESIIASLFLQGDARRIEAIPVLLAKNRAKYGMLIFLARKNKVEGRLLGLMKALNRIKKLEGLQEAIEELELLCTEERRIDEKTIKEKLRLYNADRQIRPARPA